MAVRRGRRGARARKEGGSKGLSAGASGVKRPYVPDILIGALPLLVSSVYSFKLVPNEQLGE